MRKTSTIWVGIHIKDLFKKRWNAIREYTIYKVCNNINDAVFLIQENLQLGANQVTPTDPGLSRLPNFHEPSPNFYSPIRKRMLRVGPLFILTVLTIVDFAFNHFRIDKLSTTLTLCRSGSLSVLILFLPAEWAIITCCEVPCQRVPLQKRLFNHFDQLLTS